MLRFAFKPRHPITRVAFTADGSEVVTAQPFTGIAVRDRLSGVARVMFYLTRNSDFSALAIHPLCGWICVRSSQGLALFDPASEKKVATELPSFHGPRLRTEALLPFAMWWRGGEQVQMGERVRGRPQVTLIDSQRTALLSTANYSRGPSRITFAADGTKLAMSNGEALDVFDITPIETAEIGKPVTISPLFTLERPDPTQHGTFADKQAEHWLPPVAFDHAGRSMFTLGLRNRVQRIDLATGGVMNEWGWRCEPIRSLAV